MLFYVKYDNIHVTFFLFPQEYGGVVMKTFYPVYFKPEPGEGILQVAQMIYAKKQEGEVGDVMFLVLPNDQTVQIKGNTVAEIRDSIGTQCEFSVF